MTLRVHILQLPRDEILDQLRQQLDPDIALSSGEHVKQPADYEVLVAGRPEKRHLQASPALRALIVPWSGLPQQTKELLREFPQMAVHNLHHNAAPVAELALVLLLAAAKFIVPFDRRLRQHDWRPRYEPSPAMLLHGKTVLILGYGAIGRRVARACQALGMEVLAWRRHPPFGHDAFGVEVYPQDALQQLLPRTEAVIIALPLTAETEGLLGAGELALLPHGAVLVNVGRGPIVQQEALYQALRNGRLRAAGLDVWYNYPEDEAGRAHTPPADFPLGELDNVVLSPHRGGSTQDTERLRMEHLANLLNAAARGEEMANRVDLERGY